FAIVVVRHPMEVARSLRRRNGFPIQAGLALWEAYTVAALDNACRVDYTIVSYDELVEKPEKTLKRLCQELAGRGLGWIDPSAGQKAIQSSLRRERVEDNGLSRLTAEQRELWQPLEQDGPPKEPAGLSQRAIEILREFEADQAGRERATAENRKLKREVDKATATIEERSRMLSQRKSELESVRSELSAREAELAEARTEAEKLATRLESAETRKEELSNDLVQAREKIEEQSRTLSQRKSELESARTEMSAREAELAAAKTQAEKLATQLELAEGRKEELSNDLRQAQAKLETAESSLDQAKKETSTVRDAHENESRYNARRIADLRNQLERQSRKLAEMNDAARRGRIAEFAWSLFHPFMAIGKRHLMRRAAKIRHTFLFDNAWYLEQNPDVLDAGEDAALHYVAAGGHEGRAPHPLFDPDWYTANCQEEIPANITPLEHYLLKAPERRISPHRLFDRDWYLEHNQDVAEAGIDPLEHFIAFGGKEGRNPHPGFDASWYLSTNPDVAQAEANPLIHFLAFGAKEGRDPHPNRSFTDPLGNHIDNECDLGLAIGIADDIERAAVASIESTEQLQAKNEMDEARVGAEHTVASIAARFQRFGAEIDADPASIAVHIIVYSSAPSRQLRVTLEALNGGLDAQSRFVHVVCDWPEEYQNVKLPAGDAARIHCNRDSRGYYASIKAVMDEVGSAHYCIVREGAVVRPEVIDALAAACVAQAWFDVASPITNGVPGLAVGMVPLESVETTSKRLALINGDASGIEAPMVDLDVFFVTKKALKKVPFPGFEEDKTDQSLIRFIDALRTAGHTAGIVLGSYALTFSPRGYSQSQVIDQVCRYVARDRQPRLMGELQAFTEATSNLLRDFDTTSPVITARRTVCVLASSMLLRGGVIVLVNWANQLIIKGFDVRVYVQHLNPEHEGFHRLLFKPKAFTSVDGVVAELPVGSAVVATFWPTAVLAEEIVNAVPDARGYYFIQDYEVDFYAADGDESHLREQARKSYECQLQKVVTSRWIEGKLVDQEGIQPEAITRIPVGIDHMLFPPQKIDRSNRSSVVIAAMARPETPRRGFQLLVESLRELITVHRNVSVVLFGSDDLAEKDIPFPCELLGVVAPHELHRVYSAADVFVDTSDFQGFGLAPLEAMAFGCACVVTDSGGVTEYACDQENALVVEHSPEAVSSALGQLVQDAQLRARLADAAVETAERFDYSRTADEWAALFTADGELNADEQPGGMAVVIPIYNQLHAARRCIESVLAASLGDHHLVLVDDHSDTHTADALAQYAEDNRQITYLRNPENLGFVGAANRGMAWAGDRGMDVILLNSDTAVVSNWLERLQNAAYADKQTGIVSPLSTASSHLYLRLNPGDSFQDADRWLKENVSPTYPTVITPEGWCLLIKRGVYQRLGGFDTVFGRGYCEESDYCMRAVAAGYRLAVCDNLMVFHQGKVTFGSERSQRYLENRKVFDRRWHAVYRRLYEHFLRLDPLHSLRQRYAAGSAPGQAALAECPDLLAIFEDPQTAEDIAGFEAAT
ncbi:glycosyltransferase, partial [Roseovarius sp.]|uniref:glycosyltransferase n=1 Tax=Roseovarius sp. TaxID=1486281 RepID=UPI003562CD9C